MQNAKLIGWVLFLIVLIVLVAIPPVHAEDAAAPPDIIVNEIHYAPLNKTAHAEFVELYNPTAVPVALSQWTLSKGIDYVFPPEAVIAAGGYVVVAENPGSVAANYGVAAYGPYQRRLSNDGDEIVLRDGEAREVDRVAYGLSFPWPLVGDALDRSIGLLNPALDNSVPGAWRSGPPSPGYPNAERMDNPPPMIDLVEHSPPAPASGDTVTIRARVVDADGVASVHLLLQPVAPGNYVNLYDEAYSRNWTSIPMSPAGNEFYFAELPASMCQHRYLVRYRIEAMDSGGRKVTAPYPDDTQPNFALYVYNGPPTWRGAIDPDYSGPLGRTYTFDFNQMRPLPIYQLVAKKNDIQDAQYIPGSNNYYPYMGNDYPWLGTLVHNGVVYDHIGFRARGGIFRYSVGKNHWKFNFNRGHGFQAYDDFGVPYATRWGKLNFSSVMQHASRRYRGEQGMFESLSYRLFNLAGVPAPNTQFVHFRVVDDTAENTRNQYEGDFWGLYLAIENVDGHFLDAHGLPDGNVYEMKDWTGELDNQGAFGATDKSDLNAFMAAYNGGILSPEWWERTFDLPGYYSFRSILEAVHNYDVDQGKNYVYFLDPDTQKWSIFPWDTDLSWSELMFGEGNEPFRDRVLAHAAFILRYQNRLRELRDLLFNSEQMNIMLDEYATIIDTPSGVESMVAADRVLWDYNPILTSRYVDNNRARTGRFYHLSSTGNFWGMVQGMKEYVQRRTGWIDDTLLADRTYPDTPVVVYSGPGGYPADQLQFQATPYGDPQGANTFYALQWRAAEVVWPGLPGAASYKRNRYEIEATWVSPEITTYSASMTLPAGVCRQGVACRVRMRVKDNTGRWSHWSEPVHFIAGPPVLGPTRDLKVSELMYHPGGTGNVPDDELEFVELKNVGSAPVDLSNMRFSAAIDYTFAAGTQLSPGRHLVLASNPQRFQTRYGLAAFGGFDKNLNNKGEEITLLDAFGATVFSFAYADAGGWPRGADGDGYSLVPVDPWALDDPALPAVWRASTARGGSPGTDDPLPVVVNEVQIDPTTSQYIAVELYNPASRDADVSGWMLSDAALQTPADRSVPPDGARLPAGSVVPAGGYLVVWTVQFEHPLRMDGGTGVLTLFAAAPAGPLSGYQHGFNFGVPAEGASLGRYVTSDGREHFTIQRSLTLGATNDGPLVGPVVISHLMVKPPDGLEWIELTNITDQPVALYDPAEPARTWVVGGVMFQFPAGISVPPRGRLLIAGRDPAAVCMDGRVPIGTRATGPFPWPLADDGMSVAIYRPLLWGGDGQWTYAPVDVVQYRVSAGWSQLLSDGSVLARVAPDAYGDDPVNWQVLAAAEPETQPPLSPDEVVALCTLDAFVNADSRLEIRWVTLAESNVQSFQIWRNVTAERSTAERIGTAPATLHAAAGNPALYSWVDETADPERKYTYWLEAIDQADTARELAFTTPRARFYVVYLSKIGR